MDEEQEIGQEIEQEIESGGAEQFDVIRIMIIFLATLNEIIDWLTGLLNLTGGWIIIPLSLNLLFMLLILCLRILKYGFTLKALVDGWQQALALILEFIPVVGDVIPGFLGWILLGNKRKKRIPKVKIEA